MKLISAIVLMLATAWACSPPISPQQRLNTCLEGVEQKHSSRLEALEEVRSEQGYTKGAQSVFDSAKTKILKDAEKKKCYDRFYRETK